jgi:hypothetical protein
MVERKFGSHLLAYMMVEVSDDPAFHIFLFVLLFSIYSAFAIY